MKSKTATDNPSAFEIVSEHIAAMAAKDFDRMKSLHAEDFLVDWVYSDAYETPPSSADENKRFFPAWFAGFVK